MVRNVVVFALLSCAGLAWADGPAGYRPAVPAATTVNAYGGWPGYTGASTAAGSAMNGMASVISAQGDYNLSTSAAAINMTQAQKQEIENRQQWTDTYFQMQATNQAAMRAQAEPRLSYEQLSRVAQEQVPKPLTSQDLDPVSGRLEWPELLLDDHYASQRTELDALFAKQATHGGLGYSDQAKARQLIEEMSGQLKSQIRDVPSQLYVQSRTFLRSLIYAMSRVDLE